VFRWTLVVILLFMIYVARGFPANLHDDLVDDVAGGVQADPGHDPAGPRSGRLPYRLQQKADQP
jgi:hypothetical protein